MRRNVPTVRAAATIPSTFILLDLVLGGDEHLVPAVVGEARSILCWTPKYVALPLCGRAGTLQNLARYLNLSLFMPLLGH